MDIGAETKEMETKWDKYDSDQYDVKYSYEKRSLSFPATGILRVRRQRVFPPGVSYREIITLDEIDCNKQKYRTLEIKVVTKEGTVEEFKKTSEWAYIYVGMPEDYFLREHCK
jgi:hypothetical protein